MNEELQKLKEEFEQRIRELEDKYEQRIRELKDKYEQEEFPKEGDEYWYIDESGKVYGAIWVGTTSGKEMFEIGNVFKTKEEAEFEVERLKVLRELEKMGRPFVEGGDNWGFFLNGKHGLEFYSNRYYNDKPGPHYFDTEEKAKEAVEKIGVDRIKKYLFGVKEIVND
ncbi:hypothetical protein [Eremococcus coleocola]|uniref:hypothetical protein n=1 Tax=Eremococcus coleocola TaxID=88132 RepID=UPI0003FB207E|nr:hypothetical protein [Eremococcus coleocola]